MVYIPLSEKVIEKSRKDLLDLHKRVIKTYLIQQSVSVGTRRKFFKLYDMYITYKNITLFYYTPTELLVRALVLNTLDTVSTYFYKNGITKKRHKRSKRSSN